VCGRLKREWSEGEIAKEMPTQAEIARQLALFSTRFNIAPGTRNPIVVMNRAGELELRTMLWGLHRKHAQPGSPTPSNARAETITERAMFRDLIAARRCLLPASGYYEWKLERGRKVPYTIRPVDGSIFAFGAIYDAWLDADGEIQESFCLITTTPAPSIAHIHDRMPVIVSKADQERWLDRTVTDLSLILPLLKPCPDEHLYAYAVNDLVNDVRNDGPELLEPRSVVELPRTLELPIAI
jgi:putative SOS response-associated peptidase YedK